MPLAQHEEALLALAREYIANGRLPRSVPGLFWAGSGSGTTCDLCGHIIESEQIEYEFTADDGVTFDFHMRCHAIWQSAASEGAEGA